MSQDKQTLLHIPGEICPVRYALGVIGQKWKIPLLWHLAEEQRPLRYSELRRSVPGITNMMLSKSLQELETAGLIDRKQYEEIPPRVEYTLSDRGQSLVPVLFAIHSWGEEQWAYDQAKLCKSKDYGKIK